MGTQRSRVSFLFEQGKETVRRARASESTPAADGGFTALSCNIGNGLADPGRLVDYLARTDAEVVGLQEVADVQAARIDRDLAECYPHRILHPGGFAGKGVLSKFPLDEGQSVAFAPERPDLHAMVVIAERKLRVIVAHPRPPKLSRTGMQFDDTTVTQVQMVGELAVSGGPSIVLCDLNTISLQTAYLQLLAAGLLDPFRYAGRWSATFPVRVGNTHRVGSRADKWKLKPVLRIDYVLHTRELMASDANVGEDIGSDHLPVFARLHWLDAQRDDQ